MKKINAKKNNFRLSFSLKAFFRAYLHAVERKAIFFTYPLLDSVATRAFLTCLEKETRIAGYHFRPQTKTADIFLNYDLAERKPLSLKVTFYSSKERKRMVSCQLLHQLAQQNPTLFALIHTQVGFMTLKDCLQHNRGGEFLLTLT